MRRMGSVGKRSNTNTPSNPTQIIEENVKSEKISTDTPQEETKEKVPKKITEEDILVIKDNINGFFAQLKVAMDNLSIFVIKDLGSNSEAAKLCKEIMQGVTEFQSDLNE